MPFLNDQEDAVRRAAEFWVVNLNQLAANGNWDFFNLYINSLAFDKHPGNCLFHLEKLLEIPSDVVLRVADRALELSKRDASVVSIAKYRFVRCTPTLVVRLYRQTDCEKVKTRCLDLLDAMIGLGWNEAAADLAKAER